MTRQYEAVYVFDSTLEDAAINEKLGRLHGLLGNPGDLQVNHWGRRQLAYPIGRRESGYYAVAKFTVDATTRAAKWVLSSDSTRTWAPGTLENTCRGPVKSSWVTRGNSTIPICRVTDIDAS